MSATRYEVAYLKEIDGEADDRIAPYSACVDFVIPSLTQKALDDHDQLPRTR